MQKLGVRRKPAEAIAIRKRLDVHTIWKPGHVPHNTRSDGEISVRPANGRNYKFIRVSLAVWKPLQIHNWENANGPIPEGKLLWCIDGDTENCDPENWKPIERKDLLGSNIGRDTFSDEYVLSLIAKKDKVLREAIKEQMPGLIELKRTEIKHRRTFNEQHDQNSNTNRKWRPAYLSGTNGAV
jgi:hypothetical protein